MITGFAGPSASRPMKCTLSPCAADLRLPKTSIANFKRPVWKCSSTTATRVPASSSTDLIGAPIRLTIAGRSLKQCGVELKLRREKESELVPLDELVGRVQILRETLFDEISAGVVAVPFEE